MRLLFLLALLIPLTGCGETEVPEEENEDTVSEAEPVAPQKPKVPPIVETFDNIEHALTVLQEATKGKEREQQRAAFNWLIKEKEAAVPATSALLEDPNADLGCRIIACKALEQMGPDAYPAIFRMLKSDDPRIKMNAVQALGRIKPATSEAVDALIGFLHDESPQVCRLAAISLMQIGPGAKRAGPALLKILSDEDSDPSLRDAAKRALTSVAPRRKFFD